MDISHIAEAILSALVHEPLNKQYQNNWQEDNWSEKEAVVDGLMTIGAFNHLFPGYQTTMSSSGISADVKLAKESKDYLRHYGIEDGPVCTLVDNIIYIKGKNASQYFTSVEQQILTQLIQKRENIVSFEEMADIMWKRESIERYSPWAIAKMMQRLKHKLCLLGVVPELIQTKRKRGYVLLSN